MPARRAMPPRRRRAPMRRRRPRTPAAPAPVTKAPEPPAITREPIATMMLATPAPVEAEPARPITRRLWFWLAVAGAVVAGVLIGVAVQNPTTRSPDCPPDYVCPR